MLIKPVKAVTFQQNPENLVYIDLVVLFVSAFTIGEYPNELKHADIASVHKKEDKCDKTDYFLVSMLPNISKIYKKIIHNQLLNTSMIVFNLLVMRDKFK